MELRFTLDQIGEIATMFWKTFGNARVFAFHGEMGAGKTTFINALCVARGIREPVTSPTFSIINEYHYFDQSGEQIIFHLDLYRLKDEEEAIRTGVEDCLYGPHTCFVEWPERAPGIFPPDTVHVYIKVAEGGKRNLLVADK